MESTFSRLLSKFLGRSQPSKKRTYVYLDEPKELGVHTIQEEENKDMSFSLEAKYKTKEEACAEIDSTGSMPDSIKTFLKDSVNAYPKDVERVHVRAHGHAFNGTDYPVSSATIEVMQANVLDQNFVNTQIKKVGEEFTTGQVHPADAKALDK